MGVAAHKLAFYTNYKVKSYTLNTSSKSNVIAFIKQHLNNDLPIHFLNTMEHMHGINTQYLLNDPQQAQRLILPHDQNFDYHWMTITKYYKDNNTGNEFIAFATWGKRISISLDLMHDGTTFYSDFLVYEILPE